VPRTRRTIVCARLLLNDFTSVRLARGVRYLNTIRIHYFTVDGGARVAVAPSEIFFSYIRVVYISIRRIGTVVVICTYLPIYLYLYTPIWPLPGNRSRTRVGIDIYTHTYAHVRSKLKSRLPGTCSGHSAALTSSRRR
jgi:hypothetical protein